MEERLKENLASVREKIANAALRSGRRAEDVKLVAVSKTHPPEALRLALDAGAAVFGENKVQEADTKIEAVGRQRVEWHLIGHLQSNKARRAVQVFDVIQSLDSLELARRLERICSEEGREFLSVFVQVDLAGEATRSGIAEDDLDELAAYLQTCKHLRFDGLMLLPPFSDDPEKARPFFSRLRDIRDRLNSQTAFRAAVGHLSMGMSHDFEIAIEEGSTVVRVGTAIFGKRGFGIAQKLITDS